MGPETVNRLKDSEIHGDFVGRDKVTNIIMYQESEREFVVTRNANIKPVAYFTGRETELQELRQRIEEGRKSVLVSGMGGIGKTQICRKLFDEYMIRNGRGENGSFSHIGYIKYEKDMGSSLQECLLYKKQENPKLDKEAAWRELEYLAADGKLLLFVDNVDRPISADPGLQRLKGIPGAIILTSRQATFGDEFEPYQIGLLDMGQCKKIYEKIRFRGNGRKVDSEEVRDLEYIIESLAGRHTITMELLAHLARTKLWEAKSLRKELEKKGFRVEFHKDGELVNIQESYEKLYDLSGLTEAEQNVLEAFSIFPYIPLSADTCNEWLLADSGVSEEDDILMGLYQKGWLQFDVEQESYALHPVFAQFIYEKCKPELDEHFELIRACRESLNMVRSDSSLIPRGYTMFLVSIAENLNIGKNIEQNIEYAVFISHIGYLLFYSGEYNRAEMLYEKCLTISKATLKKNHPNTIKCYNNLAMIYVKQGKYEKAKELFLANLQILREIGGDESLETAAIYNGIGMVYMDQEEYKKAEEMFQECLWIWKKILGEGHLETAKGYNNLGIVYEKQKKYNGAKELYGKALRIWESMLGENHPETAKGYNNLAVLYASQGEDNKAKELYERSVRILKRVFGENHANLAFTYGNIAAIYNGQKDYCKALDYFLKSYKIAVFRFGLDHSYTKKVYLNMEIAYFKYNNNSEDTFFQCLEEQMKEPEHN